MGGIGGCADGRNGNRQTCHTNDETKPIFDMFFRRLAGAVPGQDLDHLAVGDLPEITVVVAERSEHIVVL
jgi:hypothetical protein